MARLIQSRRWRFISPFILVGVFLIVAVALRNVLSFANFATGSLLLIVIIAIERGTIPALITAVISVLYSSYFLLAPYYNFGVSDPHELFDLFIFFIVANIVGRLGASERKHREIAERHAQEIIELTTKALRAQQLEESDRLKTAILRSASHDLRTPITIIRSSVDNLLRLDTKLSLEEHEETLRAIEQEAITLDELIGSLLDLSRLNAGAVHLNSQPNSLEEVAGDVASRVFQRQRSERLRLDFPSQMPLIRFDYGLLMQAIYNVVDNAVRFEPDAGKVILRGALNKGEAQIQIINHGASIPLEDRERIMEPFYTSQVGRTGLGLPIAKGIIEVHHGRLWVEDTPGGGTTFVVALPRTEVTG